MGKGRRFLWKILLWAAVIVQMTMSTNVTNVPETDTHVQIIRDTSSTGYAWSAWGKWSLCSRTCGGGVAYQERQCLPRGLSPVDGTLPPPIVTVRVSRQIRSADCVGEAKRYRECNTEPCPGIQRGLRAEQCAVYDRKPFRGRFYTWVPYIDGEHPCLLNCRPLGQQFYASLSIAADGTPCTKPGARAMCIGGVCKSLAAIQALLSLGSDDNVSKMSRFILKLQCIDVPVNSGIDTTLEKLNLNVT